MAPNIETVQVVATNTPVGGDSHFIVLHAAGKLGWYGPVDFEVGQQVEQVVGRAVLGQSAIDHQGLHAVLCRATADEMSPVMSWAVGAVDCAAWDLHGQLVQTPVANLLANSPSRTVSLYASWLGLDVSIPSHIPAIEQVGRSGWQFTKWGLRRGHGTKVEAEACRLAATIGAVAAALGSAGAFDAVFTWDAAITELVAEKVNPADVLWIEDPLPNFDPEAYRPLTALAPLAVGEGLLVYSDRQALIGLPLRAFTLDVVACGGLTRAVELVAAAEAHEIRVYPHGRSFVPAVHLAAAYPDTIPALEYRLQWEPARQQQYLQPMHPEKGTIVVPEFPGLGIIPRSY